MDPAIDAHIRFLAGWDYQQEGTCTGYQAYPPGSRERVIYQEEAMALLAKDSGGDIEMSPAGNHIAICYSVIDLGLQTHEFEGKQITKHKVRFSWELCQELMSDGRPFSISKKYTLSLNSASNLRPDLESWRGCPFTANEAAGFDLQRVLGAPCMLNVIQGYNERTKRKYATINSIAQLPKGMQKPMAINPLFFFSLDDPDALDKYRHMEDWLKNLINAEPLRAQLLPGSADNPIIGVPAGPEWLDDDIPF